MTRYNDKCFDFKPEIQQFSCEQDWVNRARQELTAHAYHSDYFKAICIDKNGRRCLNGGDFMRATKESTYPVFWIWPDQNYFDAIDCIREYLNKH